MRKLKHLPLEHWPKADHDAFDAAYRPGNIFDDDRGPGAHHSEGWRRMIRTSWRRWLGFLTEHHAVDLQKPPAARITSERMRTFVEHLSTEVRSTTVGMTVAHLHAAARLIAPTMDWRWLASLKAQLAARAKPEDRFGRLVPPWHTLDFGMELMDGAAASRTANKEHDLVYRDGLLIALVSVRPIRRRSIAVLTVSHHIEIDADGVAIVLHPEDTKSRRADAFRLPDELVPYFLHYLKTVRPRLPGAKAHDGLWASNKGCPLTAGQIYTLVRARTMARFGKPMGLHDFRRAAATFIATEAPSKTGLIPGVLHHTSPEVSEQHYNLARSVEASRRFAAHLAKSRAKLRLIQPRK